MKKETSEKSRTTSLVLAIIVGMLGIHCFYTGRTKRGVTMLILSITVVGFVVSYIMAIIDIIKIASGNFKDGKGLAVVNW